MGRASIAGLDRKTLRQWLALFFVALAVPTGLLIYHAYTQLKWEAFYQYRVLAQELATRIDSQLSELAAHQDKRSFSDYSFLLVSGDEAVNYLQRSPLAAFPVVSEIPGLIGYFQVDSKGGFSTPLLPPETEGAERYGIPPAELEQRAEVANELHVILRQNQLVEAGGRSDPDDDLLARSLEFQTGNEQTRPSDKWDDAMGKPGRSLGDTAVSSRIGKTKQPPRESAQAAFDRLAEPRAEEDADPQRSRKSRKISGRLGAVEELKLDQRYQSKAEKERRRQDAPTPGVAEPDRSPDEEQSRKQQEQILVPQAASSALDESGGSAFSKDLRIRAFESEIDAFDFSMLDSGHFVLFRKVWREGERHVQGLLFEQQAFLRGVIESLFYETAMARMSDLIVAYRGEVFSAISGTRSQIYISSASELSGALLYQSRLSAPFSDLELIFSINQLPTGPGASVITWLSGVLLLVLCGGFYLMYRLGGAQIDLARQQQDFVSAVSHELKTPLTSIRMYGEMLREGWASDDKRKSYYDYIFDESERLSRLIENVLQLARMTRNELKLELKPVAVAGLMDRIRSSVSSHVERAGFTLNVQYSTDVSGAEIAVDPDAVVQIIINLVDNAIKFSAESDLRQVDMGCSLSSGDVVRFSVRDYGPGIDRDQMKKIFQLFYRAESELTRETVGTGIGLALVRQLARSMNAEVDVVNKHPGAEFTVSFATV